MINPKASLALLALLLFSQMAKAQPQPKKGETWMLLVSASRPLTPDEYNDLQSSFIILMDGIAGINSNTISGSASASGSGSDMTISLTFKQDVALTVGKPLAMISPKLSIPSLGDTVMTLTGASKVTPSGVT